MFSTDFEASQIFQVKYLIINTYSIKNEALTIKQLNIYFSIKIGLNLHCITFVQFSLGK